MSNCSQNCWIDGISAVLCFKRLFHTGVLTFGRFVRPLLPTILCVREIASSGSNNRVYTYHIFWWFAKKRKITPPKKVRHRTNFEADLWPETGDFFGGLIYSLWLNWTLPLCAYSSQCPYYYKWENLVCMYVMDVHKFLQACQKLSVLYWIVSHCCVYKLYAQ